MSNRTAARTNRLLDELRAQMEDLSGRVRALEQYLRTDFPSPPPARIPRSYAPEDDARRRKP